MRWSSCWSRSVITFGWYVTRHEHLMAPWRKVMRTRYGMCSLVVLVPFVVVGLLDSLHYRPRLEAMQGIAKSGYSVEVLSVLDKIVAPLRARSERTYSAPLAAYAYAMETVTLPDGTQRREYPRLKYGGAQLKDPATELIPDVLRRTLAGVGLAVVGWIVLTTLVAAWLAQRRDRGFGTVLTAILRGQAGVPWRAMLVTAGLLLIAAGPVVVLSGHYHVLGTDKVGQDVLYQTLKSVRTGLVIGTLTTLIMLPFALLLGIMAGYFRGWVDDVIQYVYTTLNSIPGVLLIAASVLIIQVVLDRNADMFETVTERADLRLLALCLILGITSWTGLCRLLRGEALKLRELDYVQAAHAFGVSDWRIISAPSGAERDAYRADHGGDGLQRTGAGRGGAVLCRRRCRSVHDQLRHHDQQRTPGACARAHRLVVAGGSLRVHVRPGAVGEPVCRCGARCLRPAHPLRLGTAAAACRAGRTMTAMAGRPHHPMLLEVDGLSTWLDTARGVLRVVDGVSFGIARGETFALVGESGCGKSMTALSLMRLLPDIGHVVGGRVVLEGTDLLALSELAMRSVRGSRMAMIFQEPALSLNPVMPVGAQIVEVLARHTDLHGDAAAHRAREILDWVGIPDAARQVGHYPFQLSGGMKQRVMIAIALACHPSLLIADEPTTALDVTIQAQVLELLRRLQRESHMSIMLITHDLGVVSEMAHRVAVMYAGEIVEISPRERFFGAPAHPYSAKLFEALPGGAGRERPLAVIPGTVPPLDRVFAGCRFADRCDRAWSLCRQRVPPLVDLGGGQQVRCHLYGADAGLRREARGEKREGAAPPSLAIPAE